MKREQNRWKMGSLMALVVFLIFAVCVLMVLLTGADVYKRLVDRDRASYDQRTAVNYLTTKVRQADLVDMVRIQNSEDRDVLVITEEIDGNCYETWIYCYDGYIRELFTAAGSGLPLEAGDKVLEAEQLMFCWEAVPGDDAAGVPMLKIEIVTADGASQTLMLHLRSGEEVVS